MKTVKDIALELGVSRQAVHKEVKRQSLNLSTCKPGEQLTLTDEEADRIKQAFIERREKISRQSSTVNHKLDNLTTGQLDRPVVSYKSSVEAAQQRYIDFLEEQLRAKDEQIGKCQEECKALTERLAESQEALNTAQDMAKAAQALHAGTIQQQIEDKKGFFYKVSAFFRKGGE